MSASKVLPFVEPKKRKREKKPWLYKDDLFMEDINGLRFHVTKYHTVHIDNGTGGNCLFKKDIDAFIEDLDSLKLDDLDEGQSHIIEGSGDNDHLVFTRKEDDIEITLKKRGFETIERVKSLLRRKK